MASTYCYFLVAAILLQSYRIVVAESIQGCGGFVEASSALIKSRKPTDGKLDYSHVTVELQTLDGLVKDRTQCAPNGYYFIPVYDKFKWKACGCMPHSFVLEENYKSLGDNALRMRTGLRTKLELLSCAWECRNIAMLEHGELRT